MLPTETIAPALELADRVIQRIGTTGDVLRHAERAAGQATYPAGWFRPGLSYGHAGPALLRLEAARAGIGEAETAYDFLREAVASTGSEPLESAGLFGGTAGLALVMAECAREEPRFGPSLDRLHDQLARQAAARGGADTIVEALPGGYDAMLGRHFEDGKQLSGGQWQKIALSRAFMRQAPIVVLDEPTAAIDAEAESEVFGRLREISQGATALLIAHRFSTVRIADKILVVEGGRLTEEGSHEELLRLDGTYARLFHLQAAGYVTEPAA